MALSLFRRIRNTSSSSTSSAPSISSETPLPPLDHEIKNLLQILSNFLSHSFTFEIRKRCLSQLVLAAKGAQKTMLHHTNTIECLCRLLCIPHNTNTIGELNEEQQLLFVQDTLDILNQLMTLPIYDGDHTNKCTDRSDATPKKQSPYYNVGHSIILHTKQGELLFKLLTVCDMHIRYDCFELIKSLLDYLKHTKRTPDMIEEGVSNETMLEERLLLHPEAVTAIIDTLKTTPADFIRNSALTLLVSLTENHFEIQKLATFHGCVESVLSISEKEISTALQYPYNKEVIGPGNTFFSFVGKTSFQLIANLSNNEHCVKYMREANIITSICPLIIRSLSIVEELIEESLESGASVVVTSGNSLLLDNISALLLNLFDITFPLLTIFDEGERRALQYYVVTEDPSSTPSTPVDLSTILSIKRCQHSFIQQNFVEVAASSIVNLSYVSQCNLHLSPIREIEDKKIVFKKGKLTEGVVSHIGELLIYKISEVLAIVTFDVEEAVGRLVEKWRATGGAPIDGLLFALLDKNGSMCIKEKLFDIIELWISLSPTIQSYFISSMSFIAQPSSCMLPFVCIYTPDGNETRDTTSFNISSLQSIAAQLISDTIKLTEDRRDKQQKSDDVAASYEEPCADEEAILMQKMNFLICLLQSVLRGNSSLKASTATLVLDERDGVPETLVHKLLQLISNLFRLSQPPVAVNETVEENYVDKKKREWMLLLNILKLFLFWSDRCYPVVQYILSSAVGSTVFIDLVSLKYLAAPPLMENSAKRIELHVKGLSAFIVSMLLEMIREDGNVNDTSRDDSLMDFGVLLSVVDKRLGLTEFISTMDKTVKSKVFTNELKSSSNDGGMEIHFLMAEEKTFRLYDPSMVSLLMYRFDLAKRQIIESYLGGSKGSEDKEGVKEVDEFYSRTGVNVRELIEMQATDLEAIRNENTILKEQVAELTSKRIMDKSSHLVDKLSAVTKEAEAMREQLDLLEIENANKSKCLMTERQKFASKLHVQQKHLEGVVLAYTNLEAAYQVKEEELILANARAQHFEDKCKILQKSSSIKEEGERNESALTDAFDTLREKSILADKLNFELKELKGKHESLLQLLAVLDENVPSIRPYVSSLSDIPSSPNVDENLSHEFTRADNMDETAYNV